MYADFRKWLTTPAGVALQRSAITFATAWAGAFLTILFVDDVSLWTRDMWALTLSPAFIAAGGGRFLGEGVALDARNKIQRAADRQKAATPPPGPGI